MTCEYYSKCESKSDKCLDGFEKCSLRYINLKRDEWNNDFRQDKPKKLFSFHDYALDSKIGDFNFSAEQGRDGVATMIKMEAMLTDT